MVSEGFIYWRRAYVAKFDQKHGLAVVLSVACRGERIYPRRQRSGIAYADTTESRKQVAQPRNEAGKAETAPRAFERPSTMMYLGEIAQLITAIVLAFNCWQSWRNGRVIAEVHKQTNSLKDELVAVTAKENYKAGVKHGEEHPL